MLQVEKTPAIKFDGQKFHRILQPYLAPIMESAIDELAKRMQEFAQDETFGGTPGRTRWREDLRNDIKRIAVDVTNNYVEGTVGLIDPKDYEVVRALLIAYGSGSRSVAPDWTASPIVWGPEGRSVWDDELMNHTTSQHKGDAELAPDTWNQFGNKFVDRAFEGIQSRFETIIKRAVGQIPANLLASCFTQ